MNLKSVKDTLTGIRYKLFEIVIVFLLSLIISLVGYTLYSQNENYLCVKHDIELLKTASTSSIIYDERINNLITLINKHDDIICDHEKEINANKINIEFTKTELAMLKYMFESKWFNNNVFTEDDDFDNLK